MAPRFDIPLCRPPVGELELEAAAAVLRSGWLLHGARGEDFEAALAEASNRRHAVVVSSGTAALTLALTVAGVGPGDEVVLPAFTFPATANTVALLGARPILVDVRETSWNLDPALVPRALGPRTRLVLPVDQLGLPADVDAITQAVAGEDRAPIDLLLDAACSLGGRDGRGRPAAARGRLACLSFHPRKTLTTGEGGAVLCDDDSLAARLRRLRSHGMEGGDFIEPGYNLRLTDFQSAIGLAQLGRLDELVAARRAIAARYHDRLAPLVQAGRLRFQEAEGAFHPSQTVAIVLGPGPAAATSGDGTADGRDGQSCASRDRVRAALAGRSIEAGLAGWALHRTSAYRARGARASDFPIADALFARGLALPCFPGLPLGDVDRVAGALLEILGGA